MGYIEVVQEDGPQAFWTLTDAAGSTAILDSSGNGYTGTVQDSGTTLGNTGVGLPFVGPEQQYPVAAFNGSSNGILVPNTVITGLPVTLECWSRLLTQPGWIWQFGWTPSSGNGLWWGSAGSTETLDISLHAGDDYNGGGPNLNGSGWHYCVTTIDGSGNLAHYVDNSQVHTASGLSGFGSGGTGYLYIGQQGPDFFQPWNGYMSCMAVYRGVLSTGRMSAHYNEALYRGGVTY